MLIFGTRPEAIKMSPLIKEFQKYPDEFRTIVTVSGQHRQMLDQVLDALDVTPDYDLDIMSCGQDLTDITIKVLSGLKKIFLKDRPDAILVHGDTSTSTAAALAGFYHHIPVGHVEAGLRTNDLLSPWPEEANRQLTSRIVRWHFVPTEHNRQNLLAENIKDESIIVTGNTVIDALQSVKVAMNKNSKRLLAIEKNICFAGYDINRLKDKSRELVLVTAHRRENIGVRLKSICNAMKSMANKYKNIDFICPMHPNPMIRGQIKDSLGSVQIDNLFLTEPLEYFSFVYLMDKASLILTDSGGIQEEALGIGTPVLVMRDVTERPEAITSGIVKLIGTAQEDIEQEVAQRFDGGHEDNGIMRNFINPYGDGNASVKIVNYFRSLDCFKNDDNY